jgi:hypothetical protein
MTYTITPPVLGQPIPPVGFGEAVKDAIEDLDLRTAALETNAQTIVARGRRTTSTGSITTTETGALRLDNIPVVGGKIYRISTSAVNLDTSVANDIGSVRFRVAYSPTTGTAATIASTLVGFIRNTIDDAGSSNVIPASCFYMPSADGYISVLVSAIRNAGTGNLIIFAAVSEPFDLVIEFGGDDPGDTGVVI